MLPFFEAQSDILVYHYTVRGHRQFVAKMVNGGQQMELHKGKHGGRHWRYCYRLYKEGKLDEEYGRILGKDALPRLRQDGYVFQDPTIRDIFKRIKLEGEWT